MQRKTQVVLTTAALLAGAAVLFYAPQISAPQKIPTESSGQVPVEASRTASRKPIIMQSIVSGSDGIASLQGTHHGVRLLSRDGDLIISAGLRDLFDYYLSAIGEASHPQLVARIESDLQNQLSGSALQQALAILTNYIAYKTELVEFDQQYPANKSAGDAEKVDYLAKRQQALVALQNANMGFQVAQIFFAYDRTMDDHNLEKSRILLSDMSSESKEQALINLNAQLPFDAFQHQQRNQKQQQLMVLESTTGLSTMDKFEQRSEIVGEAAAIRLAELDKERAQWQSRLNNFQSEVDNLKAAKMAKADYETAYQKLLEQHFARHEQLRAKALTH